MIWLICHAADAYFPGGDGLPSASEAGMADFARRLPRESSKTFLVGAWAAALAFQLTPLFTVWLPVPSALLPAGTRERHALALSTSRLYLLRQVAFLIKTTGSMCWAAHPTVRERLGLQPYPADPQSWRT